MPVPVSVYRLIRGVVGDGRQVMARKSDPLSDSLGTDDADGWLGGIVADEDDLDRRALWRLGLWGLAAVGAVTLGLMSGQLPLNAQRTQLAGNEFAGRTRLVEASVQENQIEARRLAAAIETLNSDRDRLFSRLSSLEQGLDVVTGSIKKIDDKPKATPWPDAASIIAPIVSAPATVAAPAPAAAAPPALPAAVAALPATPPSEAERAPVVVAARSDTPDDIAAPSASPAPPSPSAIEAMPIPDPLPAAVETEPKPAEDSAVALAEFGLDLGSANSINGLRALWRGLARSHKTQLDGLRPLIAVQERRSGLGLQLRLVAGPIRDAAAAARICAVLSNADRDCKTTSFDGQRLSLSAEPEQKASPVRPATKRRSTRAPKPAAAPTQATAASSVLLGIR
jgi:hypothetical protein